MAFANSKISAESMFYFTTIGTSFTVTCSYLMPVYLVFKVASVAVAVMSLKTIFETVSVGLPSISPNFLHATFLFNI